MNNFRMPPSWNNADIFGRHFLTTPSNIDKEYWSLIKSFSEVKDRGMKLLDVYQINKNKNRVWRKFQSYIRNAENYWKAGVNTSHESSALLYYYCFMNMVKAYLIVVNKGILAEPMVHGIRREHKMSLSKDLRKCVLRVTRGEKSIFRQYYKSVFKEEPPSFVNLHYTLAFATDVSFQYREAGMGSPKNCPMKYRFAIDEVSKKCWTVVALYKELPLNYYRSYFSDFFEAFEEAEVGRSVGPSFREMFEFIKADWGAF